MNVFTTIINILLIVFFNTTLSQPYLILTYLLFMFGMWGIFKKCGLTPWHALIPCLRESDMGKAAGMEREGRILAVTQGLLIVYNLADLFVNGEDGSTSILFLALIEILIGLIHIIYLIKIYLGLIDVYGRKKRFWWLVLWLIAECIPAILWGWGKKYNPLWKAEELKNSAANFFSGSKAAVLDQGLTVNLEERTATDFFKKKYLLRDIHMYIQPGHMVLLLGGSGAGKTTYINAVNGYEKAKAEVVLNGKNMYKNYKDMQYDIGFVPQLDLMRGSDTVYRTLMDSAALRLPSTFTKAERQARVEEVMEIFGLTPVKNNLVVKLSGGQRKRLSIAMEFISNPTLFILDEPDSGLDGVMARELFQQLRKIADQGKIIIVITHTPDRVIDLFDDVIVLAKDANRTGRLAFYGSIEEARAFFGKERMEEIVKAINREEEGGEGRADEFIMKFAAMGQDTVPEEEPAPPREPGAPNEKEEVIQYV
jgi:ABC-type multidrug transport system ATPase subunit